MDALLIIIILNCETNVCIVFFTFHRYNIHLPFYHIIMDCIDFGNRVLYIQFIISCAELLDLPFGFLPFSCIKVGCVSCV